jgi:hypothetical protein
MSRCPACKVGVESGQARCPLCFTPLDNSGETDAAYPSYAATHRREKHFSVKKLFVFISIVVAVICVTINALTWRQSSYPWSLIVVVSVSIAWSSLLSLQSRRINAAGRVLIIYALLTVIVLLIDGGSNFTGWSTSYVIPFLTIATTLLLTIMVVVGMRCNTDYAGYLVAILIMSICPLLLFMISVSHVLWPSIAALTYSLLTVVGFYVFSDGQFKAVARRRLHF